MKILSWNVNGIRSTIKKNFKEFIKEHKPDILLLQEVKAEADQVSISLPKYKKYWNSAEKKGYSGTAVLTRVEPQKVTRGIEKHDKEGRVQTLEFEDFYLVNVYAPNAKRELRRLDYKIEWDNDFLEYLKELEKTKPVIFGGDMNVSHKEIDIANPDSNRRNAGFTDQERTAFTQILNAGFVDTWRKLHPEEVKYTFWSYMHNARKKNIGWRLDYFCVSEDLMKKVKDAFILTQVMGSDHCPVGIEIQ